MGHTLVASIKEKDYKKIEDVLQLAGIINNNIVPFGRTDKREEANKNLPYHVTIAHWGKAEEQEKLVQLEDFRFRRFTLKLNRVSVISGCEEGSTVLCFEAVPDVNYEFLESQVKDCLKTYASGYLHLTLNISKDTDLIKEQAEKLNDIMTESILLDIEKLDLYHIWEPVKLIKTFKSFE